MSITSLSPRQDIFKVRSTPEEVGPGSYDITLGSFTDGSMNRSFGSFTDDVSFLSKEGRGLNDFDTNNQKTSTSKEPSLHILCSNKDKLSSENVKKKTNCRESRKQLSFLSKSKKSNPFEPRNEIQSYPGPSHYLPARERLRRKQFSKPRNQTSKEVRCSNIILLNLL